MCAVFGTLAFGLGCLFTSKYEDEKNKWRPRILIAFPIALIILWVFTNAFSRHPGGPPKAGDARRWLVASRPEDGTLPLSAVCPRNRISPAPVPSLHQLEIFLKCFPSGDVVPGEEDHNGSRPGPAINQLGEQQITEQRAER